MSFPSKGSGNGGGGGTPSGNSGKAMRLLLGEDMIVNQDEFKKVEFDQIPFNDGFTWNAELDVEAQEAGTVIITASIGAIVPVGMENQLTVGCLLFKNGQPMRQNSKTKLVGPYCIAEVCAIDKCVVEDKYTLYVTILGGDELTATITSDNGVTALDIAYL